MTTVPVGVLVSVTEMSSINQAGRGAASNEMSEYSQTTLTTLPM